MEVGVIGGLASWLFSYNRENFMFDREQKIKREFQHQGMAIKQFELYREDVRDLIELTVGKMDNFLVTGTLMVTFNLTLLTEGHPVSSLTEPWFQFLWAMTGCSGTVYFLISIWLAMHASVSAHSFGVRMLTQFVRLPVPDDKQMDDARGLATEFETAGIWEMLKFPVLRQQLRKLTAAVDRGRVDPPQEEAAQGETDAASSEGDSSSAGGGKDSQFSPAAALKHVKLYRQLQSNWQAYDAYARVSLAMGMNQFCLALGYYTVGLCVAENQTHVPAICCAVIFAHASWLLLRLDLYLPRLLLNLVFLLLVSPPLLAVLCLNVQLVGEETVLRRRMGERDYTDFIVPVIFFLNLVWVALSLKLAWADETNAKVALPRRYRSVLYLDVFGTLSGTPEEFGRRLSSVPEGTEEAGRFESRLGMSESLQLSLHEACKRKAAQLKRDLDRWESPVLKSVLGEDDLFAPKVAAMRARFADAMFQVGELARGGTAPPECKVVWLSLSWEVPGSKLEFYFNTVTNETRWSSPPETDATCSLADVESRLSELMEMIGALMSAIAEEEEERKERQDAPMSFHSPSSPSGATRSAHAADEGADANPRRASSPNQSFQRGVTSASDISEALNVPTANATEGTSVNHELQNFYAHSAAAGSTFQPYSTPNLGQRHDRRRTPGTMPWTTFKQAALTMTVCWGIGFVYSVAKIWKDLDLAQSHGFFEHHQHHMDAVVEVLNPELAFAGPWPHTLFSPRSIACHPRAHGMALLAETYAVFEVDFRQGDASEARGRLRPVLGDCLARAPEFQGRGIRSVSLECADGDVGGGVSSGPQLGADDGRGGLSGCVAVLFGDRDGDQVLRCPVGNRSDEESIVSAVDPSTAAGSLTTNEGQVIVHGGPWRALATTGNIGTGGGSLWAMRNGEDALIKLQYPHRKNPEAAPDVALRRLHWSNVTELHVIQGSATEHQTAAVLGLEPAGTLRASILGSSESPSRRWRLFPDHTASSWTSVCSTGQELLFAGELQPKEGLPPATCAATAALWRVPLPNGLGA
eukprot:TRINITY_DN7496_c0_g3_i1.p1 TRINITY_DN7496_c0_g3~~TRINITY_DN7496_c0_g3_i1.p1  ORF type:complete len:1037 (-),score=176.94 TRINITY_DN7496_c0_g3_i1:40-3150(-)